MAIDEKERTAVYPLRLPAEVKEKLTQRAADARRSLNNEIVVRLENSLKAEEMLAQAGAAQ